MGRPRHTSVAEQNVWMEQRIAELEAALADATQERDENLQALSNTIDFANKTLRQIREATRKEIEK